MLEAPPNTKATFAAMAKAWPCLLKMMGAIRESNHQLPHFFLCLNSTQRLKALNEFKSSHGSKR